jgi:hypothetical protein
MNGYSNTQLIANGISQIFAGDKSRLDEVLGGQGWRYVAGAICIFPLTIIKVIDFLFRNKHLYHQPKITPMEEMEGIGLSSMKLKRYARFIYASSLEEINNVSLEDTLKTDLKEKEISKLSAVQVLQNMFNSNLKLEGTILKITRHKVNDEDMLESAETGVLKGKFLTQRITFGNDTNALLKTAFPLLKLRNLKNSSDTYFVFENDEVFELEMKLRNTFMVPVTIILRKVKYEK